MDMENQVKANSMRIMVLEEQNGALRNSIAKVLDTQKRGPREVSIYPWNGQRQWSHSCLQNDYDNWSHKPYCSYNLKSVRTGPLARSHVI